MACNGGGPGDDERLLTLSRGRLAAGFRELLFALDLRLIEALIFSASPPFVLRCTRLPPSFLPNDSKRSDLSHAATCRTATYFALAFSLLFASGPASFAALHSENSVSLPSHSSHPLKSNHVRAR